jgi:transposase-like protein
MVDTREIAEEYRLAHWAQVMQDRAQSGLSIKAYCRQIGICGNTYYYWQRRLRAAASEVLAVPEQAEKSLVPRGWAKCEASSPEVKDTALTIEIGSYRVSVETGASMKLLGEVCRTLAALC